MPEGSHKRIRCVVIHHNYGHIYGFSFIDKDKALLWKIGDTHQRLLLENVSLAENEVIVGVNAKLSPGHQSFYTDL